MLRIVFLVSFAIVKSSIIVEYRFSENFGQVFHDYSGNSYHAINGESYSSTAKDTTPTDRGAYFDTSGYNIITLPPNDKFSTQLHLPSTFTIMLWINALDPFNFYVFYRKESSGNNNIYMKRGIGSNNQICYIKSGSFSYEGQSISEAFKNSTFYLDIWQFITFVVSGTTVKCNTNGINRILTTISPDTEIWNEGTDAYSMSIGRKDGLCDSMGAMVWNFIIFNTEITESDYYGPLYTPGNCLVSTCPATCDPSIKIGSDYYCISTNMITDTLGDTTACSSTCENAKVGCFTSSSYCLSCSCEFKSCVISGTSTVCWCPSDASSTSTSCSCYNGGTYDGISTCVSSCHSDCSACTVPLLCTTCIASYASTTTTVGCKCNDKYYNTTALSTPSACLSCNSHCATCSQADICLTCIALNASPTTSQGCSCNAKYYASDLLSSLNGCSACHTHCNTCSTSTTCLTCIAGNASPASEGCACNDKYYLTGSLTDVNACTACHSHCATCDQANVCLTCIALNADKGTVGCSCKSFFFLSTLLTDPDGCIQCNSHCSSCSEANKCISCKALNASPLSTAGCECNSKFYLSNTLEDTDGCSICHPHCLTCSTANICLECIASYASPASEGCECNEKYYESKSLDALDACSPCHAHCATCTTANVCETCIASNSDPSSLGCACKIGFYPSGSLDNEDGCSSCHSDCYECDKVDQCLSCKDENSMPTSIGCTCNDGFYALSTNPLQCSPCPNQCKTCTSSSICTSCTSTFANIVSGNCICPYNSLENDNSCICNEGFYIDTDSYNNNICSECHTRCQKCYLEETNYKCLLCSNTTDTITDTEKCIVTCSDGYYNENNVCISCPSLCLLCNSFECFSCASNAQITNDKKGCLCIEGYTEKESVCGVNTFGAKLEVSGINRVSLEFEEELDVELSIKNVVIDIASTKDFTYSVEKKDILTFYFPLKFSEDIKEGTIVNVTIIDKPMLSKDKKALKDYFYTGELHEYLTQTATTSALTNMTAAATQVIVSSSLVMAVISNPSAAWILMNTIQIISYIPLNSSPIPVGLKAFMSGLGSIKSLVPNPFEYIFDSNATAKPYPEALDFGFSTSVFFINIGSPISTLVFIICLWPFIYVLSKFKLGKLSVKLLKILGNYKYNFFLRYLIQAYLELGVASFIQLRSVIYIQEVNIVSSGYFNKASAILFSVICM